MKFGRLIECNIRSISLEKSYTKCGGQTSPRHFSEKFKLIISLDQWPIVLKFYTVCFYYMVNWGLLKHIETKLLSAHIKPFEETKRGLELVSQRHFRHNFRRKIFLLIYCINWPDFIVWLPLLCEIWQIVYCNCL